jgi:hypothetical protein
LRDAPELNGAPSGLLGGALRSLLGWGAVGRHARAPGGGGGTKGSISDWAPCRAAVPRMRAYVPVGPLPGPKSKLHHSQPTDKREGHTVGSDDRGILPSDTVSQPAGEPDRQYPQIEPTDVSRGTGSERSTQLRQPASCGQQSGHAPKGQHRRLRYPAPRDHHVVPSRELAASTSALTG